MATITKAQHLQLIGLLALAEHHAKRMDDIKDSIHAIVGGEDDDIGDVLWADRGLKWLLDRRGITVIAEKKRTSPSGGDQ